MVSVQAQQQQHAAGLITGGRDLHITAASLQQATQGFDSICAFLMSASECSLASQIPDMSACLRLNKSFIVKGYNI